MDMGELLILIILENDIDTLKGLVDYGVNIDLQIVSSALDSDEDNNIIKDDMMNYLVYLLIFKTNRKSLINILSINLRYKQLEKILDSSKGKYKTALTDNLGKIFVIYNGETPQDAIFHTIKVLLEYGANPNIHTRLSSTNTLLDISSSSNNFKLVKLLTRYGANITDKSIRYAKENRNTEMYNFLVSASPSSPTRLSPTRRSPTRRSPTKRRSPEDFR